MKHYKFDKDRGIIDEADNQVLQLVGGTNKFRKLCGTLLVERLNVKARGDAAAEHRVQADEATVCLACNMNLDRDGYCPKCESYDTPRH